MEVRLPLYTVNEDVTNFARNFVYMAYKPPQIPEADTLEMIVDRYNANYRQTYIEHPRLRLDGVYIAVCHYV
jgi:F-box protein 9